MYRSSWKLIPLVLRRPPANRRLRPQRRPKGGRWFPLAQPRPLPPPPRCEFGAAGSPPVLCTLPPDTSVAEGCPPTRWARRRWAARGLGSLACCPHLRNSGLFPEPQGTKGAETGCSSLAGLSLAWESVSGWESWNSHSYGSRPKPQTPREDSDRGRGARYAEDGTLPLSPPPPVPKPTKASCQMTQTSPGAGLRCQHS